MLGEKKKQLLPPFDIVKIHWRIQATVHFLLSLPLATLTVFSWGVPITALYRLVAAYLALYLFIYFPLYRILPYFTLHPVARELKKIHSGQQLTDHELTHLVAFLVNFPLPSALLTAIVELSAFVLGGVVWKAGVVPELIPIMQIALFETIILGFVISINISFLNLVQLENYTSKVVEQLVTMYPRALAMKIPIRRVSMFTKIFFLILLTTIAGEISILIFFATFILTIQPDQFLANARLVMSVIGINILYVCILAPIVAKNFTAPMQELVRWIKEVTQGNLASRIRFITNDETGDIISGSNLMISRLDQTTNDLTNSLQLLKNNQTLIESEKKTLTTILFGVVDGVIALNNQKQIILMNKAAEDILKRKEHSVLGKPITDVLLLHGENDEPLISDHFFQPTTINSSATFRNIKLLAADAKERYINLTCSTTGQQTDSKTAYILTFHDTTEEHELAKMKLDFVSMAAHELRTPTTIIRGYMETFLTENTSKLNKEQSMMLNRVLFSSRQLSSLINSLLSVSRIERKSVSLHVEKLDWETIVRSVVDDMAYIANEKHIHLSFTLPTPCTITVAGDRMQLSEVFNNLVANAITYTKVGGSVTISVEDTYDMVTTHITDTGIGIPEEAIPHLFTKFYRVNHELEMQGNGTGLGLYLSKAIIELHGGKIWVTSKVNEGSTFSFSLPKIHIG